MMDHQIAKALVQQVIQCSSVERMSAGPMGIATTYLPGERVNGIKFMSDDEVSIHVDARWGFDVHVLAREVRSAVHKAHQVRLVNIVVEDITIPFDNQQLPMTFGLTEARK